MFNKQVKTKDWINRVPDNKHCPSVRLTQFYSSLSVYANSVYLRVHPVVPLPLARHHRADLEHAMCSRQHSHIQLQKLLWMIVVRQDSYVHFDLCKTEMGLTEFDLSVSV